MTTDNAPQTMLELANYQIAEVRKIADAVLIALARSAPATGGERPNVDQIVDVIRDEYGSRLCSLDDRAIRQCDPRRGQICVCADITKFNSDGNVEASYLTSDSTCSCPAGQRPTCRHRRMLSYLRDIVDTHWFLDWDNGRQIVDLMGTSKATIDALSLPAPAGQHVEEDATEQTIQSDTEPAVFGPVTNRWRRI